MTSFTLRPLTPEDGQAFANLLLASPDTGQVHYTISYKIDPFQALVFNQEDLAGVVAEIPGVPGLVGGGLIGFKQARVENTLLPSALLNTLIVHPDHRRIGIASAVAKWRLDYTRQRFAKDCVIWAIIQRGNTGSLQTAKKWCQQILPDCLTSIPLKLTTKPPHPNSGLTVHPIQPGEYDQVAEKMNRFYKDFNLYPPETAESLQTWLAKSPFDAPIRHYWVVADKANELLAGLAITESSSLRTSHITYLPPHLKILNAFFHIVPPDGTLRELGISKVWFDPGNMPAAQYLWETVRYEWREKGTVLMVSIDMKSPLKGFFNPRLWDGKTYASIVLTSPIPFSADRYVY